MAKEFTFNGKFCLTDNMKNYYSENGFILVKNFLDKQELDQLWKVFDSPDRIMKHSYTTIETGGKKIQRVVFTHPGSDVSGMVARSQKVVNTCEELLGGEVYHYHTKCMLKNPREAGPHVWHQDYGYWYDYNLFPDMMSVWIPLDKATTQNSCLQLLKGSYKCGRIDHVVAGATLQKGADLERVEQLKKVCPHIYCEMDPGDALFFHANTIHKSDPNESDMRRWAIIMSYNKASNDSFVKHHHANYTPIVKVPDEAITACTNYTDFSGKDFLHSRKVFDNTTALTTVNTTSPK